MRILLIDVETAPSLAYVWGLWEQNVGLNQLLAPSYMLCWSAKWLDGKEVFFSSKFSAKNRKAMLEPLHKLLDEADAVIHYNGTRFDIPHINREFILQGMTPPSPYREMDLLQTIKKTFKFVSNKLQHVSEELGIGSKIKHSGFELWVGCIENDEKSWELMQEYNIQDVLLLEKLYYKLQPWIKRHINYSMYEEDKLVCPHCGGNKCVKRGFTYTLASKFQRYRCTTCGTWFKDNKRLNSKEYKTSEVSL